MQAAEAFLTRPDNAALYNSLTEVGFPNMQSLLDTYIGDRRSLAAWLRDAQINRDKDLRLQYLAGFALNNDQSDAIYQEMRSYKVPPVGLRFLSGFAAPQSQ
jgi:spermidine synthase